MEAHENTGKSAMLHIAEILIHGSDERHPLSQQKILEILKNKCNVTVNRKTVGKNLTRMKETGWPVECRQVMRTMNGKKVPLTLDWYWKHHLSHDDFNRLSEMLYFSHNSPTQIKKILTKIKEFQFQGENEEKVFIKNIPNNNYSSSDLSKSLQIVSDAITGKKRIDFSYMIYDIDGKLKSDKNVEGSDKIYSVSPYLIVASDGRYYLLGNEDGKESVNFFTMERMANIKISAYDARVQKTVNVFKNGVKLNELVGVYPEIYVGNEDVCVCEIAPEFLTRVIEVFGKSVHVTEVTPNKIKIEIKAFVSAVYGLAMRNSSFVRVISPADLVKKIRDDVKNLSRMYGGV